MYKIGELSKLCNMSVKALRYYDSEGLLVPDRIDKFTGYRYYSASKLADCYRHTFSFPFAPHAAICSAENLLSISL